MKTTTRESTTRKDYWHAQVADVREKIRQANDLFESLRKAIEASADLAEAEIERRDVKDLDGYWRPPLFARVHHWSLSDLLEFERDVTLIGSKSPEKANRDLDELFHRHEVSGRRQWEGKLFELSIKARLLQQCVPIEFDCPLGVPKKGKGCPDVDVRLGINERTANLECTVLTQSERDEENWNSLIEAKKIDPDHVGGWGVDLYANARRFLLKVYDKIAKDLDPNKSQCQPGALNVLLISFPDPCDYGSDDPWVDWAIDQLFSPDRRRFGSVNGADSERTDISLGTCLIHHARTKFASSPEKFMRVVKDWPELAELPRHISAILMFDRSAFVRGRINYHAFAKSSISHREMVEFESLMERHEPGWSKKLRS